MRLPTRLDRYPAKMVSKLADRLIERYALDARRILDPFCGSGAVLMAARRKGIAVSGIDINPVAGLFSQVKLHGFNAPRASQQAQSWIASAKRCNERLPIEWTSKGFWFTDGALEKFERLRFVAHEMRLKASAEGRALLLSYTLAIRLCSRADQRSPKPFISKRARRTRQGRHFDPYATILNLLQELSCLYGVATNAVDSRFITADVSGKALFTDRVGKHSHSITSPPYINAQDYFRNFKLELYLLERLLPFRVDSLRTRFIGTERGDLLDQVSKEIVDANLAAVPQLRILERREQRLANVVHRYLHDMGLAFNVVRRCLEPGGTFVVVCGDNLVGGLRICTWQVLQSMLEAGGFRLFDRFADQIGDRLLAPKRCGHKGLIKEEIVSAYTVL